MWGESSSTVSNVLYESSGRVLAFLGSPVINDRCSSSSGSGSSTATVTKTTTIAPEDPSRNTPCTSPDSAAAADHLQLLRCVKALLDQGTCFHVLCQSNCSRELLLSAGVERDRFTLLNPLRTTKEIEEGGGEGGGSGAGVIILDPERDDSDPDPEQAVVNALDMARALTSRASVVLALDVDFSAFPATELCSQCCAEGGQVHIIGNTPRSTDSSALEARDLLSADGPRPPNILHQFSASTFLTATLLDHFSVHVPIVNNMPPWTSPSKEPNTAGKLAASGRSLPPDETGTTTAQQSECSNGDSVDKFQAAWWNIYQQEEASGDDGSGGGGGGGGGEPFDKSGEPLNTAESGANARPGVNNKDVSVPSTAIAPVVPTLKLCGPKNLSRSEAQSQAGGSLKKEKKKKPSKHSTSSKSRKKKKSGKRKEGRSSTAALLHLQRRLRSGLDGLDDGPSPLKSREDLLDVLTDLHLIQPPPSHRRLQKIPELGRTLVAVVAKLNDALDADAIQIVQSAALLINRWKDAIAIESGVATSESAFGRPNDDPERGEDSVHAPTTAPVVLAEAPSQLRENITTDSKHREVIALSDDVPPKHDDSRRESDLGGPEGAPIARKQFLPDATAAAATHAAKLALEATAAAEAAVRQSQHGAGRQSGDSPNARAAADSAASALLFAPREPAAPPSLHRADDNTSIVVPAQPNDAAKADSDRNNGSRERQPAVSSTDSDLPTDYGIESVRPCRLFMMGLCSAGVNCAFRHDVDSRPGNAQDILSVEAVTDDSGDDNDET